MRRHTMVAVMVGVAAGCLLLPGTTLAQSAVDPEARRLLQAALEARNRRVAEVDNYTLIQEVNGSETSLYFEKRMVDGVAVFVVGNGPGETAPRDEAKLFGQLGAHARLAGQDEVDGAMCHRLETSNLENLDLMPRGSGAEKYSLKTLTLWLDPEAQVVRRMMMEGEAQANGQTIPITIEVQLQDYRSVGTMYEPFRTVMKISGLNEAVGGGDPKQAEEMKRAQAEMARLREQMASMPPEQRKMMEAQLAPMLKRMEGMMGPEGMQFVTTVKSIVVNRGPPENR